MTTRVRTLTVADVARLRNTTEGSARRWLYRHARRHLRRTHGRGQGWVISARAFAIIQRGDMLERLMNDNRALREELEQVKSIVAVHARALVRLKAL